MQAYFHKQIFMPIFSYFRKSAPSAPFTGDDAARMKLYKKLRFHALSQSRHGRLQPLLRLPYEPQCGQEADPRKRCARRHAAGHHRLGAAVRLCHRQIRQRIPLRPQQHQAFHGRGTVRFGRRQPAGWGVGLRQRRGHGRQYDAFHRLRRDVGRQRVVAVDGRAPRRSSPSRAGTP